MKVIEVQTIGASPLALNEMDIQRQMRGVSELTHLMLAEGFRTYLAVNNESDNSVTNL